MNNSEIQIYDDLYRSRVKELAKKITHFKGDELNNLVEDSLQFIFNAPLAVSGKSYRAAAAGAVYLGILKKGYYIQQNSVAIDADVCEVTVRKVSMALARDNGFDKRTAHLASLRGAATRKIGSV